ncbi:MAG: Smr/MutS family protein [Deltaproteobacteria bacterium]|nr:Smr/MutS family protein [Deltaproteobacteria bacterium]
MAGGEIDLHGLTVAEALSRLASHYNARIRAGDTGPIRVVHGYGSSGRGGELRAAVREFLARNGSRLEFTPGEQYFNNPGVTVVYPKHPLPAPAAPRYPVRGR